MQKCHRVYIFVPTGKCILAGSSVYIDRLFMQRYLPQVDKYLHYHIVDVSTIKELCRYVCWNKWKLCLQRRTI